MEISGEERRCEEAKEGVDLVKEDKREERKEGEDNGQQRRTKHKLRNWRENEKNGGERISEEKKTKEKNRIKK